MLYHILAIGDVTSEDDVKKTVEAVMKAFGHIDILVNNAGIIVRKTVLDTTVEEWDRCMDIGLKGTFLFSKHVVPIMIKEGGGVIVNVCSVGATHQTAGAAYCASKGAVLAATKNTAFMYMEEGIRCNALSPGGVVTDIPLVMPPADEFGFGRTSKLLDFSGELAMPEDLADAILFLASDQSRYVNGEELKCDGGWTCF